MRKLNLDNVEVFENYGLDYFVNDLMKYVGKKVVIVGGGDFVIDWVLMLEFIVSEVYLIYCCLEFCVYEYSVLCLKFLTVNLFISYLIDGLFGNVGELLDICLKKVKSDEIIDLMIDVLIVNYGFIFNLEYFFFWGFDSIRNVIIVKLDMFIFILGVYVVGDICIYEGKVKLIVIGFGEVFIVVNNVLYYINLKEWI